MSILTQIASTLSIVSFIYFGTSCLISKKMVTEFNRYNLSKYRQFIGSSQIAASLGLVCGFYFPALGKAAAGGLAVQMFCGVLVRIHIKDSFAQIFPALFFFILNLFIALV